MHLCVGVAERKDVSPSILQRRPCCLFGSFLSMCCFSGLSGTKRDGLRQKKESGDKDAGGKRQRGKVAKKPRNESNVYEK